MGITRLGEDTAERKDRELSGVRWAGAGAISLASVGEWRPNSVSKELGVEGLRTKSLLSSAVPVLTHVSFSKTCQPALLGTSEERGELLQTLQ